MRAPGALRLALEWRAPLEFGASLAAMPLLRMAPTGDGHPVLVFPGLRLPISRPAPLRRYLKDRDYAAHKWQQGRNFGPGRGVLAGCATLVQQLRAQYGRKVSLIGWSLGGIYARETAKQLPDAVRSVITLGTPFTGHPRATNAWRVYEMVSGERVEAAQRLDGDQAAAAGADHVDLQPHRRHRGLAVQRAGAGALDREHRGRTPATSASASIRPCSMPSPTVWRSPKAHGSPSTAAACKSLVYKDPAAADWFPASCLV